MGLDDSIDCQLKVQERSRRPIENGLVSKVVAEVGGSIGSTKYLLVGRGVVAKVELGSCVGDARSQSR